VSVQELLLPPDFDPAHPLLQQFGADLGVFATEYAAGVDLFPASGTTAALNLVFMPQQFQIGGETFGEGYEFIGPSPEYREGTWLPRGRKILYVSQGTVYNRRPEFFELCVKAFTDTDWNVVMAVGDHVDLGVTPDNFEVAPYVPQPAVLRNATAFLSQGGMGSVMDSLYYEVPVIGVPHLPEQATIMRRVEELGLGARLDIDGITPEQLRAEVEEVATDPVIRANLEIFSEHVRGAGGAARGADVLVKFAGQA
jgi:MGT family glycosyltransferase